MLGDIHSESPRAPSPWDDLIRASTFPFANDLAHIPVILPKLVPEVEEGAVEYKLKLLDPSPARFARLVTQLKWRLLEGQGQAYYEIGVADSGLLIGLTRPDLEKSIETLEEMAGEIGASVIIVKEIEVPDALVNLSGQSGRDQPLASPHPMSDAGYPLNTDDECKQAMRLGSWDRRMKREPLSVSLDSVAPSTSRADTSTEPEHPVTADEFLLTAPTYSAVDIDSTFFITECETSNTNGDPDLFMMDFEPHLDAMSAPALTVIPPPLGPILYLVDLSIASVFKPRPGRLRLIHTHHKVDRRQVKWEKREKKLKSDWTAAAHGCEGPQSTKPPLRLGAQGQITKTEKRRMVRDEHRENKHRSLVSEALVPAGLSEDTAPAREVEEQVDGVLNGLEDLRCGLAPPCATDRQRIPPGNVDCNLRPPEVACSGNDNTSPEEAHRESRHLVEVLVVRKLSVEEAYGDFGFEGFDVE